MRARGRRMEQAQPPRWDYGAALLGLLAEGSLGILDLEGPRAWAQAWAGLRGAGKISLPPSASRPKANMD